MIQRMSAWVAIGAVGWMVLASGQALGGETMSVDKEVQASASQAASIPVLLITGANNHNWQYTSRLHAETLAATGLFDVTIADDPAKVLAAGGLDKFKLFIVDYNGPRWGDAAEKNFLQAVENGAGAVLIHAANNAFVGEKGISDGAGKAGDTGWVEYQKMCGLMWVGGVTGHGQFHKFHVRMVHPDHPVVTGLPDIKDHPDELYHKLVNTQNAKYDLLATALSTAESGGTGVDEPMAVSLQYGKGRIFHTPLGHVWPGSHTNKYSISDPQFKILLTRGAEWAATGSVSQGTTWHDQRTHNTLSPEEAKDGWTLLFDGTKATGLRGYNATEMPTTGWVIEDGMIRHQAGQGGGDLVTSEFYGDVDFSIEWKCALGGNSGLMYRVKELKDQAPYWTGPEMQILDNEKHNDAKSPKTSAGALYAMLPSQHDVIRPAGEWNQFTIKIRGNHVEHWANGWKIVEFELNSPQWDAMVKDSKFKDWPEFGRMPVGHIAIQDHGDDVWYRNIKVRAVK